ncbi:helix-turn-helix domain-containing protein [Virgibacillus proomii]|uniref:helix-turn-helix domain-containing protein n=1 Tax=Virgibacillus proomii TaxID=84407 RepID=UPI001C121DF2|nr:helix-turn-helix domain-containing protein [Virgibacillus proomii]MBU5266795.1 helix-turn-helix domain-containing protein [Virgibacillus proomii]
MCRVLIASPVETDRAFLKQIFAEHFFNVTFLEDALSAEEAYKRSLDNRLDMLILDISGSSDEIFQYKTNIVKQYPNIKVILLDKKANFKHIQTAIRCAAIDYIVKPLDEDECKSAIHRAILALNQVSLLHYERKSITNTVKESANQMMQYVHEYFNEEINLETLARFMHLNKSYVSRFFKETVGMTFSSYLRHYRIEQAKKLLRTSELTITEVAEEVGYPDLTYFSRIFKKETNYTPNEFKQIFQGEHIPADFAFVEGE